MRNMQIIGYHIRNGLAVNSLGECSTKDPLDFLLQNKPGTIRVFYHLDYSVANLFRWLQVEKPDLARLLSQQSLYLAPYKFAYMPKKYFNVQHGSGRGSPFANFNDMYQFHRNSDLTIKDPLEYAQEGAVIGQQVYEALQSLEVDPTALTSPVRVWEKEVLSTMDLPTYEDIPEPAAKLAYACCNGGWVEAFQKGHWKQTWDYDMRSAYGSFTRGLLDTRAGQWVEAPYCDPSFVYGYADCQVEITADFSPIALKLTEEEVTPQGQFQRTLTKQEIDFIAKYNLGTVQVLNGWWWYPDKCVTPLETMIDYLFKAKESAASDIKKDVVKRILAGIWGKFLQINKNGFGDLFNPVWAAEVEVSTRLNTAAFVLDNNLVKNCLHVAVDGVLASRQVPIKDQGKIGQWKLSNVGAGFVISSGICAIQGKDAMQPDEKEGSDFILRYDWLKQAIEDQPNAREYCMTKLSPVSVQKAVLHNKMPQLGQHEEIVKTVDVSFETKREYERVPETGQQLLTHTYSSLPRDTATIILGVE